MAVVVRLCKHCQTPFPSKTQRALYCSHTCNKEYHRSKKRQLAELEVVGISPSEEPTMKENQRQLDSAELRAYIAKHCHQYTAREIAEHLGVSVRVVDLFYPRASR